MLHNYSEIMRNCKNPVPFRKKLVEDAIQSGIKPTARKWKTTAKTVRKWKKRYENELLEGLKDRSRRPKNSPNRMPKRWQFKIQSVVEKAIRDHKRINAVMVKDKNAIPFSAKTVRKEMKLHGYTTKWRKKTVRKRDLREQKAKMKPFRKVQVDIKYLDDIPEFYHDWTIFHLPKYQITARDVRTGALFFAYAQERTVTNTTIFLMMLSEHLKKHGVDAKNVIIQTDNGSEFVTNCNSTKTTSFTMAVEQILGGTHTQIPLRACTFNSDVETSHNLIENEFYASEYFNSATDFFEKAANYQRFFNMERINRYKSGSPLQILGDFLPKEILTFKPVVVDNFLDFYKNAIRDLSPPS